MLIVSGTYLFCFQVGVSSPGGGRLYIIPAQVFEKNSGSLVYFYCNTDTTNVSANDSIEATDMSANDSTEATDMSANDSTEATDMWANDY